MTDITHIMRLADEYAEKRQKLGIEMGMDWTEFHSRKTMMECKSSRKALEDAIRSEIALQYLSDSLQDMEKSPGVKR